MAHTTSGNVLKEDMPMKEAVLKDRFNFFQCKTSVVLMSTVSGMDSQTLNEQLKNKNNWHLVHRCKFLFGVERQIR